MGRLRSLKRLVHDAVDATVEIVREGHDSGARAVRRVTDEIDGVREAAEVIDGARWVTTSGVLGAVKGVNRLVEAVTEAGLDAALGEGSHDTPAPVAMRSDAGGGAWWADAALGALNGAVGDHLGPRHDALDLAMRLRVGARYVDPTPEALAAALPEATDHLVVFVHGLGTTEWSWALKAQEYYGAPDVTFASQLTRDLGATCVFVRYNTGRHVSEGGAALCALLERLVAGYPAPLSSLVLVGHSMGGLVCRSACHEAERTGAAWADTLTDAFYLGSPHRGAPLAKLGHALARGLSAIDLPATRVIGKVLEGRSSGVKDLRHGALVDEEWDAPQPLLDRDAVPLPHARHAFISGAVTEDPDHVATRLIGDLLVRVPSASGPKWVGETFDIDATSYGGVLHHELQNHPAVYAHILRLLSGGV